MKNGKVDSMTCPDCGARLDGQQARRMYTQLTRYEQEKVLYDVFVASKKQLGSGIATSGNKLTKPKDPGGKFTII